MSVRQEVNLYPVELKPRAQALSPVQIVTVLACVLVLMVGAAWWTQSRATAVATELKTAEQNLKTRQEAVNTLAGMMAARDQDEALAREARALEGQLRRLGALQRIATSADMDVRLSPFLDGLARHRPEGLWLTQVRIANRGNDMVLAGSALSAGLVPNYLDVLGTELAFSGLAFQHLAFERPPGGEAWIDFRIVAGCIDVADCEPLTLRGGGQ